MRQHRHRGVVAHRSDGFALILRQNTDDLIALLGGDVEHLLVERQRLAVHRLCGKTRVDEVRLEIANTLLQPGLIGMARLQDRVDVFRLEQRPGVQIEGDHVAGSQLALADDVLGRVVPNSGL